MKTAKLFKTILAGTACALAVAGAAAAQTRDFNIPDGELKAALNAYVRQSGQQVIFRVDELKGAKSRGVRGALSSDQALARILAGTGFTVKRDAYGSAAIVRSPSAQAVAVPVADATANLATSQGDDDPAIVDEIIVTASKRAERLKDVPASVTAVTGEKLTAIGAQRLEDYAAQIPGFVVTKMASGNGTNQLTIRGVSVGIGGNPTVGVYIDGSPFGGSNGFGGFTIPDLDPQDLARVEVLRGPQGTLYGAGSLGGLLKYVTAEPDYNRAYGRLSVEGANVDGGGTGYGVRAAGNLPLADTVALRLSAYDRVDPGFITDAVSGAEEVNEARFNGARAALAWRLSDAWTLTASALLQRATTHGSAVMDFDPVTERPAYGDLTQVRSPGTGLNRQNIGAYGLEIEGDLGFATLSSASSYNRQTSNFNLEITPLLGPQIEAFFGIPGAGASVVTQTGLEKFTQEVRLTSPTTETLSWMAGVFYTREKTDAAQHVDVFDATTGATLPLPALLISDTTATFEEIAAFANVTWRFTPRFDVTLGVRYSQNDQDQTQTTEGLLSGPLTTRLGKSSDDAVTWLVNPRFRVTDHVMLYGRLASGYRPGGPNVAYTTGLPATYGPDTVVNYEAGLKADFLDRTLSLDVAAFYIDWKDIQIHLSTPVGIDYLDNVGSASSKGVEASLSWRPVAGLVINANVAHTVAELGSDLATGTGTQAALSGDALPLTPRWAGAISADYTFPIGGDWDGTAGASFQYVGDRDADFTDAGSSRWELPSYETVDLRLGVRNDRFAVTAFVHNVGDTRGQVAASELGSVTRVAIIQPRTFRIALSANF